MEGEQWLSMKEAARTLGTSVEGLRKRIERDRLTHGGKFQIRHDNKRRVQVLITLGMIEQVQEDTVESEERTGGQSPSPLRTEAVRTRPDEALQPLIEWYQTEFERMNARYRELLAQQRSDYQVDRDQLRKDVELARQDASQWREALERERRQAETLVEQIDQLRREHRVELDQARRPWWRRLIGK
jgi:DnaJ-domain-containing protein 1